MSLLWRRVSFDPRLDTIFKWRKARFHDLESVFNLFGLVNGLEDALSYTTSKVNIHHSQSLLAILKGIQCFANDDELLGDPLTLDRACRPSSAHTSRTYWPQTSLGMFWVLR